MIDKGDGDREQKQQQRDNLRDVITFCENKIDCRRSQVLGYLGERFDKSKCNRTCDNCERNTELTIVDRTAYAVKALRLAQEIDDRYTLIGLLDAFRGSAAKKALKYQDCEHYGAGRELSKSDAERLLQSMVTNQVLRTYNQTNPSGFTTSYVKLGPKWKELENGKLKITLTVCDDESPYYTKKAAAPKKTSNPKSSTTTKSSKSGKRNAQVIRSDSEGEDGRFDDEHDIGDYYDQNLDEYEDNSFISDNYSDDEEDIVYEKEADSEIPSSPVYNSTSVRNKKTKTEDFVSIDKLASEYQSILHRGKVSENLPLTGKSNHQTSNPVTKESSIPSSGLCYDYLIQWRDGVAQSKKVNAAFVMSNSVLGQIARQLPLDRQELSQIAGMSEDKILKYGDDILTITNRFIL